MAKVQVVFYSMYGHVYRLAEAVAEGAREAPNTKVELYQVPELMPEPVVGISTSSLAASEPPSSMVILLLSLVVKYMEYLPAKEVGASLTLMETESSYPEPLLYTSRSKYTVSGVPVAAE